MRAPLPTWGLSTESPWQQWGVCEAIVRQAPDNQALLEAAAGLISWAWQERPLDPNPAGLLLALDSRLAYLDAPTRHVLRSLKGLHAPLPLEAYEDALARSDEAALGSFLEDVLSGPTALAWLGEIWESLAALADHDLARRLLAKAAPKGMVGLRLSAELALHQGNTEQALALARGLAVTPLAPFADYLTAHLLERSGEVDQAVSLLAGLRRAMPWHANLTLKLHDLVFLPRSSSLPPDRTAVLLYTWNKADLVRQTLESLLAGDLGDNPIFVLDNGSVDATPETLEAVRAALPPGRLTVVRLPVNVGAPAARNWLLSLSEVRACSYAAFLDDDVVLPSDWLARLLTAAKRHPECHAVGCSIRDHTPPHRLQSADYHLLHRLPGPEGQTPGERVRVFNNCTATLDLGMFRYERPCLSVSGCCHLIDLSRLDLLGGFDVRFSPTQFDDLDRDMRAFKAGLPALYAGHLAVDHVQRSSLRQASTPAQVAHIQGNKMKLEASYPDAALDAMVQANLNLAWNDLLAKARRLEEAQGCGEE
ncbi:glycosyltransferase [Fundidesulfovibrio butyratiphilus]